MISKKHSICTFFIAIGFTITAASCGSTATSKKNAEIKKCENMLKKYAEYATDKECKDICELMFTDEMMKKCNKLYFADMKLQITNRNLMFKQSFSDLFESIEYEFTDVEFSELSDEDIEWTEEYYKYFGFNIDISSGYLVSSTFSSTAGYNYSANFAVVKVDEDEWRISPQIWEVTFGQKLEPIRKTYSESDFYSLIP